MNTTNKSGSFLNQTGLLPQEEVLEIQRQKRSFSIGIPKEEEGSEARIPLAPLAVKSLIQDGYKVFIQRNFAKEANFKDVEFTEVGAEVYDERHQIFKCDIIIKIKPLSIEEIEMLKGQQLIITSLHANMQSKDYYLKLLQKRVTAIAFETLQDNKGRNPIVRSMSEIAGRSAILIAAEYLSNVNNGKGEMLGGITGVSPSEVVIIGAGTAGIYAAQTAHSLGALVKVFDDSFYNLDSLQNHIGTKIFTSAIHSKVLANALRTADVVIGAIRTINKRPNFCVTEEMVAQMKNNSIIIDICIDQGGCFETSKLTSHKKPVYKKHGVIHYCVPNIPSRVARTASYSISNILSQELLKLNKSGSLNSFLKNHPGARTGVYIFNGILTNEHIGDMHGLFNKDIDLLLAAL
jgi:alanine dehydrogenase